MIIVLNGPLGIGKSTLSEALVESIDHCVMLDGDQLVAANPPPDGIEHLHSTITLLIEHHWQLGYRHFVINHFWGSSAELDDLRQRLCALDAADSIHCFLLTLSLDENLRRIRSRQRARAIDEREFERRTVVKERDVLFKSPGYDLGEPFDVSGPPVELVATILRRLRLR